MNNFVDQSKLSPEKADMFSLGMIILVCYCKIDPTKLNELNLNSIQAIVNHINQNINYLFTSIFIKNCIFLINIDINIVILKKI